MIIGAVSGGFLLLMMACCAGLAGRNGSGEARTVAEAEPEDVVAIPASLLLMEYKANEIAADKNYKGRILEVSGSAKSISRDILENIYVTLDTGRFEIFSVQCFFSDDFEDEAAQLSQGQYVTVRGRCEGKFGNVMLKDCVIVE